MQRSFSNEIKYQWNSGGMHIKLIFVNVLVFLLISLALVFGRLAVPPHAANPAEEIIRFIFALKGDFQGILMRPWGLITSIFAHFGFLHLLFNMVFLFFISRFFLQYFSNQRLLYTYVLGGIAGGILQVVAHSTLPYFQDTSSFVVGASGAVNAVFMATAFYRPMAEVHLFGLFRVKMLYLALLFFFMDLFQMANSDQVAHFAHLGGAIFGFISIRNLNSKNNIITLAQRGVKNISLFLKREPRMKSVKGGKKRPNASRQTDEEYNSDKKRRQEEIDKILDKIAKSGYDSLTKREKQILFEQSSR